MLKYLLLLFCGSTLMLSGCAHRDHSFRDEPDNKTAGEERLDRMGKVFGDDAFEFGGSKKRASQDHDPNLFPINKYLWQATLDTLSYLPLRQADAKSGVILTEWYQDTHNPTEKIKVDIHLTSKELKSDAIKISVFRQKRADSGQWRDLGNSPDVAEKLADTILRKARHLKFLS